MREIYEGQVYKHFKGALIEIIAVAKDSEDLSEKIVYKHLDTNEIWVRDKDMFLSKVDKIKYPDVEQEYRFMLQEKEEA